MNWSLEQLWIHRYALRRRDGVAVEGALIRWGDGVGCLQPWPHLGTASLAEELAALQAGQPLLLGRRALEMAGLDGIGRANRFSLWDEVRLPRCHQLILAGEEPTAAGRRPVKVKVGENLEILTEWLAWGVGCKQLVRADANAGTRRAADWRHWWRGLDEGLRAALEFIEDPLPRRDIAGWEILADEGLPLAWDWEKPPNTGPLRCWTAGVFKPGARTSLPIAAGTPAELAQRPPQLVISGMLGHPLGELWAAWLAGRWGMPGATPASWRISRWHGVSGWETLEDADEWRELLGPDEHGLLRRPEGAGFGLAEKLEKLMWRRLA